jgi:hypothetical protein
VKLYTGNGSTQTISGLGFSPDLVWAKVRNMTGNHSLYDIVRGALQRLSSSTTSAEATFTSSLTSFDSGGFSLGSNSDGDVNASGATYVAWTWDAGSSTVTNTQGSITSQVRANASAGFSVVTFSAANAPTVGHGLGVAPSLIIAKSRTVAVDWTVYHRSLGKDYVLVLNDTGAAINIANYWGTSEPSSTVFGTFGNNTNSNNRGDMVAYCFAPVAGYSSFGSYTGNGLSSGVFVYTGFAPRWIFVKRTDSSAEGGWCSIDSARETYNYKNKKIVLSDSSSETAFQSVNEVFDFLSNGFIVRSNGFGNVNGSTNIYAAFAEHPFQFSRAR